MSDITITPADAQKRQQQGAQIVDIRESADFLRLHIPGARSLPLSEIQKGTSLPLAPEASEIIFHCQGGMRTRNHAGALMACAAGRQAKIMEGGINAWQQAGLPVNEDKKQPLPIMRQVQITAGCLILLGVILGYTVNQGYFLLSGFIGAGLLFAGVSGWCGMANLLVKMPWNKS